MAVPLPTLTVAPALVASSSGWRTLAASVKTELPMATSLPSGGDRPRAGDGEGEGGGNAREGKREIGRNDLDRDLDKLDAGPGEDAAGVAGTAAEAGARSRV